ncbi:MAG: hypothetical protein ACK55I_04825, partial [bacterium]
MQPRCVHRPRASPGQRRRRQAAWANTRRRAPPTSGCGDSRCANRPRPVAAQVVLLGAYTQSSPQRHRTNQIARDQLVAHRTTTFVEKFQVLKT